MKIAYDAKRAFLNRSGLGNYSRTLISSMSGLYPDTDFILYTTKNTGNTFSKEIAKKKNIQIIEPANIFEKTIPGMWRSLGLGFIAGESDADVYHGLSNELPLTINKFKGKKIVTIHDLLFLRFPEYYPFLDRQIYFSKVKSALKNADAIVSVSNQTSEDIQHYFHVTQSRIHVIYQACDKKFGAENMNRKSMLDLPEDYLLYVGTIEERKNLVSLIKAMHSVKDIPLIVVGKKKGYYKKVQEEIFKLKLSDRIFFRKVTDDDLPELYRRATALIYPSLFEGFGIPIQEALLSGTPVITSKGSCFPEAGGPDSIYSNPLNPGEISDAINSVINSSELRSKMSKSGLAYAKRFSAEAVSAAMMELYRS